MSLCQENVNKVELRYFYIDLDNKHVVKIEYYDGSSVNNVSLRNSTTYKYEYNSVKDTDIVEFDKSKYEDYTYNEF